MNHPASPLHRFIHHTKVIALADRDWQAAEAQRVCGLHVEVKNPNHLLDQHGRKLRDFSSTSYLGLDYHPTILAGAIQGLQDAGTLRVANVRQRCQLTLLEQYENELSELFGACCLSTLSCSAASAAILPLLASGALTGNTAPVMVFDRRAHCSMSRLRALCSDETQVITVPHNDMNVLEDLCKRYAKIVYVADAVYPMGGVADLDSLLYLKDRYGVFLYLDDSHGLSTVGQYGAGSVRPRVPALDDDLLVVASLANAFGASGAAVMFANPRQRQPAPAPIGVALRCAGQWFAKLERSVHRRRPRGCCPAPHGGIHAMAGKTSGQYPLFRPPHSDAATGQWSAHPPHPLWQGRGG